MEFELGAIGRVTVTIFDVQGRRVRTLLDGERAAGLHRLAWNGRDERGARVRPGVYLVRARANGLVSERKLVLIGS